MAEGLGTFKDERKYEIKLIIILKNAFSCAYNDVERNRILFESLGSIIKIPWLFILRKFTNIISDFQVSLGPFHTKLNRILTWSCNWFGPIPSGFFQSYLVHFHYLLSSA